MEGHLYFLFPVSQCVSQVSVLVRELSGLCIQFSKDTLLCQATELTTVLTHVLHYLLLLTVLRLQFLLILNHTNLFVIYYHNYYA